MKKKNTLNIVVCLVNAIFTLVAICVMFAPAFGELARGTLFHVMFGSSSTSTNMVPELIAVLVIDAVSFILSFFGLAIKGKGQLGTYFLLGGLNLVAGIMLLFSAKFFALHNTVTVAISSLGAGTITSVVFSFLAVLVEVIAIFLISRKDTSDDD